MTQPKKPTPKYERNQQRMLTTALSDWLLSQYAKRIKEFEKPKIPENGINAKELKAQITQYGRLLFEKNTNQL